MEELAESLRPVEMERKARMYDSRPGPQIRAGLRLAAAVAAAAV